MTTAGRRTEVSPGARRSLGRKGAVQPGSREGSMQRGIPRSWQKGVLRTKQSKDRDILISSLHVEAQAPPKRRHPRWCDGPEGGAILR